MSELIAQYCTSLEQWQANNQLNLNPEDILNDLYAELVRLQSSNAVIFRQEMKTVTGLLGQNIIYLNEVILTLFSDYFIQLLKQWKISRKFDDQNDAQTFENLESIIVNYTNTLTNEILRDEFVQCLEVIANTGKEMFTNENIRIITHMLIAYTNTDSYFKRQFMDESPFDGAVIKCLCSDYTIDVFRQFKSSVKSSEFSFAERFVFEGLFDYINLINRDALEEHAAPLREHLLASIGDLMDEFLISSNEWSHAAINILTDLTTTFLYSVQMTEPSDLGLETQKHICDTAIRCVLLPTYLSMKFNKNCLQYIYMGTLNDKILDYFKTKNLTPIMFQISGFYKDETEIQFNIYRTLAAIMTEEDIKRLDDPGAIAKVFLDQLNEIKDLAGWETRIKNLLTTLKILLQHDQIRDEIFKQNGVELFIYCAMTARYDSLIQQRAVENLLIMSFDNIVCQQLKDNAGFMAHIKFISESSSQSDLQRAGSSLLWRLTKDETSKTSANGESSKTMYDVMISYSHKDEDLCFRLYDRLIKDHFRVWLDRDQMHGTPLESMSNAIENSEFVFVCMSDAYKQSGYCKMEAYYALERQCCIIPLVMKAQYKADGWLGIIVTGRMRVDFPKYGFENAYEKLMVEIDRNRKEKKQEGHIQHHEVPSHTKPEKETVTKPTYQTKKDHKFPSNVEQWTEDDVQQFCLKQNLENFLPICDRMNGKRLIGMYQMCSENSPVMFQSLNNQLTMKKNAEKMYLIEIGEYLQFLEDLKPLVPASLEKKQVISAPQSSVCAIL